MPYSPEGECPIIHGPGQFTAEAIESAHRYAAATPPADLDPRIGALVNELIGRVADKWTMLVLEVLREHGEVRFTRLADLVSGISQKMLTQILRHMERDGLLVGTVRTAHPVVPPKVEYRLTGRGLSLGAAFRSVWVWAAENLDQVEQARRVFSARTAQ